MDEAEVWLPVPSKPGVMASSFGRVLLPERTVLMPNGGVRLYKTSPTLGHRTKANKNARHEYMNVCNKTLGNLKVHKLVCEAFNGPPPDKKTVIIHKNECGTDNRPNNLKWGTQKENMNMPKFIEYCRARTGENSPVIKHKRKVDNAQKQTEGTKP